MHGAGAGFFGNPCLLGVYDVHDYAALEHPGKPALYLPGAGLGGIVHKSILLLLVRLSKLTLWVL